MTGPSVGVPPERFRPGPPPDEAVRERIRTELDANLLVEAGAGSGKTTMLVDRMLRLITTGSARVEEIAAVTFTRKAAGELRQRLQQALERAARSLPPDDPGRPRVRAALDDLDSLFAGTIHAFCARLLRERPLEAGIDPGFREVVTAELEALAVSFWGGFLERAAVAGDPLLEELERTGLRPAQLWPLFRTLMDNLDVQFPVDMVPAPDPDEVDALRREVSGFVDRALAIFPQREPPDGWDTCQQRIRELKFRRRFPGWEAVPDFMDDLQRICRKDPGVILKRWPDQKAARVLRDDLREFGRPEGPARAVLQRWWAHRYPAAVGFARKAAEEFREQRHRRGMLSFQDLLEGAARLLRDHPEARRELGGRYRRVLVDEFQDTDPIQAELLLLLCSEPEQGADWDRLVPRPGSLFVVGDPKQSIYRFRRADIALYGRVKDRFRTFGQVVELTANFRSAPEVADFVNRHFREEGGFPREETEAQARFAPLDAMRQPRGGGGASGRPGTPGVWTYGVPGNREEVVAREDAAQVASWIAREVEAGRSPSDFLVLTRRRRNLAVYARELEARNLPIQVSGARVGVEEELEELLLLLEALRDPGNPVATVAALTGLFLGVDHQALLDFRLAGGTFDPRRVQDETGPGAPAAQAMNRLNRWWQRSRRETSDVFLTGLAGELGLLPWAAAGELGSLRAGVMAYALEAVRLAAASGETSLPGAVEALRTALEVDEAETPLEPLRGEAVRVMNLHQAKGLEAPVVILAEPSGAARRDPSLLVERTGDRAEGWLSVEESLGNFGSRILARPLDWEARVVRGRRFDQEEEVRLLYVACTRAEDLLLVAHPTGTRARSPWQALDETLRAGGRWTELAATPRPEREALPPDGDAIEARVAEAEERRTVAAVPSYRVAPVTALAKQVEAAGAPAPSVFPPAASPETLPIGAPRGPDWGSVVHAVLALASRGVTGEALQGLAASLLLEHERPLGEDGAPAELSELLETVEGVMRSALWARAQTSPLRLAEVPFALPGGRVREALAGSQGGGEGRRRGDRGASDPGRLPDVVEGVVDLVFREGGGWVVADWKTDLGDAADAPARREGYRRQVELYAACWEALTGEPVKERVLLFTRTGREERW